MFIRSKKSLFITVFIFLAVSRSVAQMQLPDNILTTLNPKHPRLLVKSLQDFEDLKNRVASNDDLKEYYTAISKSADRMLTEMPSKYILIADQGGKLLNVSRAVLKRTYTLAMMYRLTHERKYSDRLWAELLAASQFPDWNSHHFLDLAEMTHAFAIGYDWLYDVWTPEQKKVIRQAIVDKGLLHGYLGYSGLETNAANNWSRSVNNWNQVCNGGLTMGALAIADEEPKLCSLILKNAITIIPNVMKRLAPDGANEEGPGYWAYGTQYNVAMIESLETALGTDFGLSEIPGFSKTGAYFITMGGPGGKTFNYADNWLDTIQAPELFWFAKRFKQPLLAAYEKQHPVYSPLEMLWYPTQLTEAPALPENNYYREAEVATMRTSWTDPDALFVGFKGGNNGAGHAHLDIGNFVFDKDGKRWLVDLSHDGYGLPGYFESGKNGKRWNYYRMKAEGHNTLVFDPDKNPDQDPLAKAKIIKIVFGKSKSFGIIDMTSAYPGKVRSVHRGIAMLDQKQVLVQDEIETNRPVKNLYWFVHTPADIKLSADHKSVILTIGRSALKAELLRPKNAVFDILEAQNMPESSKPLTQSPNKGIKRLTIHLKNTIKTTIAVSFKELNDKEKNIVKPLSAW